MKIKTNKSTGITSIELSAIELTMIHEEMNVLIEENLQPTPALEEFSATIAQHMDEV